MKQLFLILTLGVLYAQTHSLNFSGTNENLIVNHTETLNLGEELTISAWIYPNSYGNNLPRIVTKGFNDTGYLVDFSSSTVGFKVGIVQIFSSTPPPLNQWTHIVAVINEDSL